MADRSYDLTEKLGGFLDRHMSLPLLDFLIAKGIYAPAELEQGKLEVLFSTNMVDLAVDIYTARKEKPPAAMLARREEVVGTMNALSAEVQPILEIVQDTVQRARRESWLASPLAVPPQFDPPAAWTRGLALRSALSRAALLAANSPSGSLRRRRGPLHGAHFAAVQCVWPGRVKERNLTLTHALTLTGARAGAEAGEAVQHHLPAAAARDHAAPCRRAPQVRPIGIV